MLSRSRNDDDDLVLPEGLRVRPVDPVQTQFGTIRKLGSLTGLEIAFVVLTVVEIGMSLGFSIEKIVSTSQSNIPSATEDFVLAIVLTINIVFCLVYIVDGVLTEKPYELIIFIIGNFIVVVYVIGNYSFRCAQFLSPDDTNGTFPIHDNLSTTTPANVTDNTNYCLDGVKLSRLILTCVFSPPCIIMGIYLAHDYLDRGEFIFRMVGADASLQTACKILFAAISIIKLDLQLQLSMFVLILHEDRFTISLVEILILAFGVPFSVVWAMGSYFSLRWENSKMLLAVAVTSVVEPAYIFYRMSIAGEEILSDDEQLMSVVSFLFGIGALVARCVHLLLLVLCWRNFMRGLKERVFG